MKVMGQDMKKSQAKRIQSKSLEWFMEQMLEELLERLDRNEGGPSLGVKKNHDVWFYFKGVRVGVRELGRALGENDVYQGDMSKKAVIKECANVANFAVAVAEMMKE